MYPDAAIIDEPENVVDYSYDSVWKDKLTSVSHRGRFSV